MTVYVVIVTYNPLKWINKCLSSLKNNNIKLNTIVIDNGSTDHSQDFIKLNFPEVEFIQSNSNLGFGIANNIGIKKAHENGADFVFLLNQDAWIEKDTIEKLVNVSIKEPKYGVISSMHLNGKGDALDFNFSTYITPKKCPSLVSDIYFNKITDQLYEIEFVNAAAWLITRKCIDSVGGFDPLFNMYGEDNNYLQRVLYHGFHIGIHANTKIYHDREQRSKSDYLVDKKKSLIRSLMVKYCDPNNSQSVIVEINIRKKKILKQIVKFRFKEIREVQSEIEIVKSLISDIEYHKKLSQAKGLTFLK